MKSIILRSSCRFLFAVLFLFSCTTLSLASEAVVEVADVAVAEKAAELRAGYDALLQRQGEYAYAFNFFVTSMLWTVIAAALVFLMHLGFASLETGLTRSKNTTNILFKNVFIISVGILTYALTGFNTHYPSEWWIPGWLSLGGPIGDLNQGVDGTFGYGGVDLCMTGYGDFIFQAMFAATAATIVSGAVAERMKLSGFMILALLLVALAYPIAGSWHWGGGWLSKLSTPFYDFAGSSAVHAFGGFAALGAVLVLGPRSGKFVDGKIRPIPGHSMPLAAIGVFLLWLGWFGFNGGSVLSADPIALGLVFTTTALAACAGALVSMFASWIYSRKPDLTMALNGVLAGLVGITAGADVVGPWTAVLMGGVAGLLVVFSILFFDRVKIDDPVGAISVHGVCGVWGTVAVAFFSPEVSLFSQALGSMAFSVFAFGFAVLVSVLLQAIIGLRVSPEEEEEGLDLGEHGQEAYPDFVPNK
jgi:Amt family ammonium transporter